MKRFSVFFCVILLSFGACKSRPPLPEEVPVPAEEPEEEILPEPRVALVFENVEADDPARLRLNFALTMENPAVLAGRSALVSWRAEINGQKAEAGFELEKKEDSPFLEFPLSPGEKSAAFNLGLNMDIDSLAALGLAPADDYSVKLILEFIFRYGSDETAERQVRLEAEGTALFPGVRPPVFSITSIAVLQAELVNTRFRVGLKIENPNPFPVDLSALSYTLYNDGLRWADGTEKKIIGVKGRSTLTGNIFLVMNFIDMKRELLDQIIRLEDVNYRFAGEAQVITGVEYLPKFTSVFDLSGYSKVLEK